MTKLYLDVCCINRPFDDQTQDRIRVESEAVLLIMSHVEAHEWEWVSSEVLDFEVWRAPDRDRSRRVAALVSFASARIPVEAVIVKRAQDLEALGFQAYDALHIACAEAGGVDVFLTTDDRLLRLAARNATAVGVRVDNPLQWLQEVIIG